MIELKACPFCGNEMGTKPRVSTNFMMIRGESRKCAWVYCPQCNAKTGYFFRDENPHYMAAAIDAWNRRAYHDADL